MINYFHTSHIKISKLELKQLTHTLQKRGYMINWNVNVSKGEYTLTVYKNDGKHKILFKILDDYNYLLNVKENFDVPLPIKDIFTEVLKGKYTFDRSEYTPPNLHRQKVIIKPQQFNKRTYDSIYMEMDYYLMELSDSINAGKINKVASLKAKLHDLREALIKAKYQK